MKKFTVSKVVYFLVLIFGLCYLSGCVPPQVTTTIPNEITSTHCIFEYNGNLDDIYSNNQIITSVCNNARLKDGRPIPVVDINGVIFIVTEQV